LGYDVGINYFYLLLSKEDHCLCALPPASGFVADDNSRKIKKGTIYIHCNKNK